jgi:hypothetical protein
MGYTDSGLTTVGAGTRFTEIGSTEAVLVETGSVETVVVESGLTETGSTETVLVLGLTSTGFVEIGST